MLSIHLYNGGQSPEQELDDWGTEVPTFIGHTDIQITYGCHVKMYKPDKVDDLFINDEYIFYDGIYYGDFNISCDPNADKDEFVEQFDSSKAK